jgi:uncharacterized membrane protein YccC
VTEHTASRIAIGAWHAVAETLTALRLDLLDIRPSGPRAVIATISALAVTLSMTIACAWNLPDVWWAGISAFVSSQATRPASLRKGLYRIAGSILGAGLAFLLVGWLAYDDLACCLVLMLGAGLATFGFTVSRYGYAWLLFGITFCLIILMSLGDPAQAWFIAATRACEVVLGTAVAMLLAIVLAPEDADAADAPTPGWTHLFGARWPNLLHAARTGIAISTIPLVWSTFDLPDITTMGTTMASVMAIPVLHTDAIDDERRIVTRAMQRLLGCVLGGGVGLLLLGLSFTSFLPWLIALGASVWVFAYLQTSTRGMTYVGLQAGMVIVMTLSQGEGPPTSIWPGINRLTGIVLGLIVLCLVSILLQPAPPVAQSPAKQG